MSDYLQVAEDLPPGACFEPEGHQHYVRLVKRYFTESEYRVLLTGGDRLVQAISAASKAITDRHQ